MGIRISDQPGDQHTQNPPPDHEAGLGEGQTQTVSTVTPSTPVDVSAVIRGSGRGSCPGFIDVASSPLAASGSASCDGKITEAAETSAASNSQTPLVVLGWVRRETGATQRIGPVENQVVRKLPPHWKLAPTGDPAGQKVSK
jgi:hypothetical protein